jgi:DNA polymerase III gamma/tau subunit
MKENKNKIWTESSELFFLRDIQKQHKKLPNEVFMLCHDGHGNLWLQRLEEQFTFDYKLYGLETSLIDRILKTYENTSGNLGALLNGIKGTGKTVTSKIICNRLNQPVILLESHIPGGHLYLNDIPQDITVLIDEYEKIYSEDSELLTIMDGAFNSIYRRMFILTTNKLYVNENLIQRPGRIRYLKTFKDLEIEVITEIVDDILVHTHHRDSTIQFISCLELITVDIVKAVCTEVNIHDEDPEKFASIFNVKKLTGKYDVYILGPDGKNHPYELGAKLDRRPDYDESDLERSFYINNEYNGDIIEVIDEKTVKTRHWMDANHPEYDLFEHDAEAEKRKTSLFAKNSGLVMNETSKPLGAKKPLASRDILDITGDSPKVVKKKKNEEKPNKLVVRTFTIEKTWMTHRNWSKTTGSNYAY